MILSLELQHRLYSEYLAIIITLNSQLDPSKVSKHILADFNEFIMFYRQYSFIEDKVYYLQEYKLETLNEWLWK